MANVKSNRTLDPVIAPMHDGGTPLEEYGARGLFSRLLNLAQPRALVPQLPAVPDTARVPAVYVPRRRGR